MVYHRLRGVAFHDQAIGLLIHRGRPQFENLIRRVRHRIIVAGHFRKSLPGILRTQFGTEIVKRFQHDLAGGKTLLAVDHQAFLDFTGARWHLFKHNRAQEMRSSQALVKQILGDHPKVFPQWLPLVLLVPYVGSLEQRHEQADVLL